MEKEQAREWAEAQAITFSVDLVEAAKIHLKFLDVVDQHPYLYEDHALKRAVYRYNAFWLPLLAKHLENPVVDGEPLVVPLDCEWIWHCHRLNPLRYIRDCETIYGRLLGNQNVISSVQATTTKSKTEEIWNRMYPMEPYELDMTKPFSEDDLQKCSENAKFTSYDLIAAVKRQMSFTYQVPKIV
ncbi:glycine-rich domain-containing protein 2-like [Silene latifolia]|uniref:glycine-rich domain-containing protein 2-like n=1 Tax=Silene latifolia TaxID=37657 RepID=UPI003D77C548